MGEFTGKVVLITGAGQGLGRRAALAFAREGAGLALNDLTPIHLDETVAAASGMGAPVRAYLEDVAKKMPVQLLVDQVLDDWGRVDAAVLAASVRPAGGLIAMDEWDWHRTLDVNLTAPFLLLQALAPAMQARGGGTIVTIGPHRKAAGDVQLLPAYAASKTGLVALTSAAARELAGSGIRINAACSEPAFGSLAAAAPPEAAAGPRRFEQLVLWLSSPGSSPASGLSFPFEPD